MNAFFARAMDGVDASVISERDREAEDAFAHLDIALINPYRTSDRRRGKICGISEIVTEDLTMLAASDLLVADLSIRGRSYVGAMIEIKYAYDHGKPIYVWVGGSGNEERIWLQYHASAITKTLEELTEILGIVLTPEGRRKNSMNTISYYCEVAAEYDLNRDDAHLFPAHPNAARVARYRREWQELRSWVGSVPVQGTVVDLGLGTGPWVGQWMDRTGHIVCIGASSEMLEVSRHRNDSKCVKHMTGNILDDKWLSSCLRNVDNLGTIVLAFVLSALAPADEATLISTLHGAVGSEVLLLVLDSQSSLFSRQGFFSRSEIQQRYVKSSRRSYRLYRRNLLAPDLCRILCSWGRDADCYYSDNYFLAGFSTKS